MNVIEYIIKSMFDGSGIDEGKQGFKELEKEVKNYGKHTQAAFQQQVQRARESNAELRMMVAAYDEMEAAEDRARVAAKKLADEQERAAQSITDADMGKHFKDYTKDLEGFDDLLNSSARDADGLSTGLGNLLSSINPITVALAAAAAAWEYFKGVAHDAWKAVAEEATESVDIAIKALDRLGKRFGKAHEDIANAEKDRNVRSSGEGRLGASVTNQLLQENELKRQNALRGVTDKSQIDMINRQFDREREAIQLAQKRDEIERRAANNTARQESIKKETDLIDKEIAAYERAITTAVKVKGGFDGVDAATASESWAKLVGFIPDGAGTLDKATEQEIDKAINAAREHVKKLKGDKQSLKFEVTGLEYDEQAIKADRDALLTQQEALDLRRRNEKVVRDTRQAEKEAAEAAKAAEKEKRESEKKAAEEAKAKREEEIASLKKEQQLVRERGKADLQANKDKQEQLKKQLATIRDQLKAAQDVAQSQMPTDRELKEASRAKRKGGYRGGGVGADGIAGTFDDEKVIERYNRLRRREAAMNQNGFSGRLSRRNREFLEEVDARRRAEAEAKRLAAAQAARQKELEEATKESRDIQARIEGDVKRLAEAVDLLRAK